jgi:hypothetical protein
MYRRADKAMVSRVLGKGLLKTKVLLDEHLIFKHNMEICKFKENPGNHAPPTDSDCATRFAIVNKRSAHKGGSDSVYSFFDVSGFKAGFGCL